MSMTLILLMMLVIVVVVFIVFVYFRPQSYIEKFNSIFDEYMNGPQYELSEQTISKLKLGTISEIQLVGIRSEYTYRLENAGYNRVLIIVTDEKSKAFVSNNKIDRVLENRNGTQSLISLLHANSGSELVTVLQPEEIKHEPRVYVGAARKATQSPPRLRSQSPRVTVVNDDVLSGI